MEQKIRLEEVCDMEQLCVLLDNWSKSTGIASVVIDTEGRHITKSFGETDFCSMVHQTEKGLSSCTAVWKGDRMGIYECPMGLHDICIPLVLPDGTNIGRVMAGQIMTDEQDENDILEKAGRLGMDEAKVSDVLSRMKKKPRREMESAFHLLRQMLSFFIGKSYELWISRYNTKNTTDAQNILFPQETVVNKSLLISNVTKKLCGFNLTVNMDTGRYTLVTGTGPGNTVKLMKTTDEYEVVYDYIMKSVDKAYQKTVADMLDIDHIRKHRGEVGYFDSCELLMHHDDSVEWYELNMFTDINKNGIPTFNILGRDVTGAHEKEEVLAQLEKAKRANEAKSLFLSNMSHDIRTPMNGIIGMTAIAGAHLDDRERVKDCLGKISVASRHLLSLINDILDLSKIESGSIALSEEPFCISELFDDVVAMVSPQMHSKNQQFRFRTDGVAHEMVIGDAGKLRRVFVNILSNAIKYTPEGGCIHTEFSEKSACSSQTSEYEFICTDNGYGMSEETLEKLFEPFARASDERIRNIQGTGLGMVITRNIVHMMGGNIAVESKLDVGSRFTINFCLKFQNDNEFYNDKLAHLKMLVVDEDVSVCKSACMMAGELGIDADYELSGEEAVKAAGRQLEQGGGYDICLVDGKLLIMDKSDVIRRLKERAGEALKIIVMSVYDRTDIGAYAHPEDMDAFISKPLFKFKMHEKIMEVMFGEVEKREEQDVLSEYSNRDFSDKRLLLVEDNELNREIACEILHETRINVEMAENGRIALEMIENSPEGYYDIVLMDIRMPVMNGLEATRAIRHLDRFDVKVMPIIATSADAFLEDIEKARDAGMNDHITKPVNLKKLLGILKYYLGDHMAGSIESAGFKTDISPAKYYEEIYFTDGTMELSAESQQVCVDVLNENGAVGIIGMLEESGLPMYCVSGFALVALGYTYEEFMNASNGCFINLVYPEDREKVMKTVCSGGHKYSFRIICKNGEIANVVAYTPGIHVMDGRNVRMTSIRVIGI